MNLMLPLTELRPEAVAAAVEALASGGGIEERGAVFTKSGVVDSILDLCAYSVDRQLHHFRLLEPSFGDGDFLIPAIRRLAESFLRSGLEMSKAFESLSGSIRGIELHRDTFSATTHRAVATLTEMGFETGVAAPLVSTWLRNDDFLLSAVDGEFDVIVGNPPYVRQERIPAPLLREYRRRYSTLYDRADLYVLFFERALDLLRDRGALGFICSNRWIKNKYGGPLRRKVANAFHLKFFIDLERADAFHSEVIAYPAITVIEKTKPGDTRVALGNRETAVGLPAVVAELLLPPSNGHSALTLEVPNPTSGDDPWLLDSPEILPILRRLELNFPTLEQAGAKVGIGVATGCDRVFIGNHDELPVEDDRKVRIAMASDLSGGGVTWSGRGVVNPYLESGELASLEGFPRFAAYIGSHEKVLKSRHTAKEHPTKWYKTIDRIFPQLTSRPKLLIPDIKGSATVAYDEGRFYPHHNLYVVTSEVWDLRALQALLRSSVALMFVAAYSVRMSGGFLRFQAQYLRRIRCPHLSAISAPHLAALAGVASTADIHMVDSVVLPLFGLHGQDAAVVSSFANSARVGG